MKYLFLLLLGACVSEQQVRGQLYQNDGIPADVCARFPEVKAFGVYRVLKCPDKTVRGCENGEDTYEQMIPYCSNRIKNFLTADRVYVEEWLRKATKPK